MTLLCPDGHCRHSGNPVSATATVRALGWVTDDRIVCPFCLQELIDETPATLDVANLMRAARGVPEWAPA